MITWKRVAAACAAVIIPLSGAAAAQAAPSAAQYGVNAPTVTRVVAGGTIYSVQVASHCKLKWFIGKPHGKYIETKLLHHCGTWQFRGWGRVEACSWRGDCAPHWNVGEMVHGHSGRSTLCIEPKNMNIRGAGIWINYGVGIRPNGGKRTHWEKRGFRYLHHQYWIRWGWWPPDLHYGDCRSY